MLSLDDSDTELKDLLPLKSGQHDDDDESDTSQRHAHHPQRRRHSPTSSLSSHIDGLNLVSLVSFDFTFLEDEHDFVKGLIFPTIRDSESSDDEFDLRRRRRPRQTTTESSDNTDRSQVNRPIAKKKTQRKAIENVKKQPIVDRSRHSNNIDDDFEILDH